MAECDGNHVAFFWDPWKEWSALRNIKGERARGLFKILECRKTVLFRCDRCSRERGRKDAALRPNQIFAVSLPETALDAKQQRAVVDVCARELLTLFGLRSLGQNEAGYCGHYGGGIEDRDDAYHQGTVWGWLLGPFAFAHLRVYGNPQQANSFLEPMFGQIKFAGLGTLSEIFDGDPPHVPNGCIAQAWTVGEVLRAWKNIAKECEKEDGKLRK